MLVCELGTVALSKGTGIAVRIWVGSGIGGALMFLVVRFFASRRLAAQSRANPAGGGP